MTVSKVGDGGEIHGITYNAGIFPIPAFIPGEVILVKARKGQGVE